MTVPTKNCPPIEQGGPGKGLSVLQRGQLPGDREGTREVTTLLPGNGTSFQLFTLICTHSVGTYKR